MSQFGDKKKQNFAFSLAGPHRIVWVRLLTGQKKGSYYDSPDYESSGRFASIEEARILDAFANEKNTTLNSPGFDENLKLLFKNIGENQPRDRAEVLA